MTDRETIVHCRRARLPTRGLWGVSGYYRLLKILDDPNHPEYQDYIEWLKGHVKNYFPYEPNNFDPAKVEFGDPKKRLWFYIDDVNRLPAGPVCDWFFGAGRFLVRDCHLLH
jgi:hypothetical protein